MDNNRLSEIQRNIGYAFNDESLLEQAFCHSSYARQYGLDDNERMEFFGDAVLEYIVSEYLFDNYPEFDQGQLSKVRALLVSADGLRPVVDRMDIMRFLLVADNAAQIKKQSKKIEANLYEAVLCAVYKDGGMDAARKFVLDTLKKELDDVGRLRLKDCKTALQEYCQQKQWTVEYRQTGKSGPDNKPTYYSALYINGRHEADGSGLSKKAAEQCAAKKIVEKWGVK